MIVFIFERIFLVSHDLIIFYEHLMILIHQEDNLL